MALEEPQNWPPRRHNQPLGLADIGKRNPVFRGHLGFSPIIRGYNPSNFQSRSVGNGYLLPDNTINFQIFEW